MMTTSTLPALAERLANSHILCVGDLMLDCYVTGDVSRISPEAPIPVLRSQHERTVLGGAGNIVRNLCGVGGKVTLVGAVGDDPRGRQLCDMLCTLSGVRISVVRDPKRKTTLKTRFVGGSQQLLRVDDESDLTLDESLQHEIVNAARQAVNNVNAVLLSDYGKGVLSDRVLAELITLAREAGRRVFVDPKGSDYTRY